MTLITMALFGAGIGVGVVIIIRALRPRPVPLGAALAALGRPARSTSTPSSSAPIERLLGQIAERVASAGGTDLARHEVELRLVDRTPARHALDKLIGTIAGVGTPVLMWAGLAASGVVFPVGVILGLSVAGAVLGWFFPDWTLKEQADRRRRAFRHALGSYLDLVNVIIAGGGGIQTALYTAADAGDGWAFASIRRALDRARLTQRSPWHTFAELADELDVPELAELAAAVSLAGSHGARIRGSLAAKADTLRGHQIAEAEATAASATERMTIPVAVLLLGFFVFLIYPAVQTITTATTPVGP